MGLLGMVVVLLRGKYISNSAIGERVLPALVLLEWDYICIEGSEGKLYGIVHWTVFVDAVFPMDHDTSKIQIQIKELS